MSSFVLAKWQETENKIIKSIELFNSHDVGNMTIAVEDSKRALRDFFEVLKGES